MTPDHSTVTDVLGGMLLTAAISGLWLVFSTDWLTQFNPFSIRDVTWWEVLRAFRA